MKFQPGQAVVYMRARSGERQAEDIPATYVGEREAWGNGFISHQIRCVLNGVDRNLFVSVYALRSAP